MTSSTEFPAVIRNGLAQRAKKHCGSFPDAQESGMVWRNVQRTNVSGIAARFLIRKNPEWFGATCKEPMSFALREICGKRR
jgi:hypothetical protein